MSEPLEFPYPERAPGPPPQWMQGGLFTGYLPAPGFLRELLFELGLPETSSGPGHLVYGDLLFTPQAGQPPQNGPAWAQNIWRDARLVPAPSIGQAAAALKALQRNWWGRPLRHARRGALITGKLPRVSAREQVFGRPAPTAPLGSWTLWDEATLMAAPTCSSPYPDGQPRFEEDRLSAPSRAYLKLWEAFTLLGAAPRPGELCLDLGSAPGGWTWVLASLGARVFSIDKAPLEPRIQAMTGVDHCLGSGFGLDPRMAATLEKPVDWVFSDMACYPARLLELVRRWLDAGTARNFVCTLKFQAETDHDTARAFAAIPGSRLMHLAHNKHELTWVLLRPGGGPAPLGNGAELGLGSGQTEDPMGGTVTINEDECIGCETCCEMCPDVFQYDSDANKAKVVNPTGASDDEIQAAIDACPASCISWE